MRQGILCGYTKGSWDDFTECEVFVTESEIRAKEWCHKFDNLLFKLKESKVEPYQEMWSAYGDEGDGGRFDTLPWPIQKQFLTIKEINGSYMTFVDIR